MVAAIELYLDVEATRRVRTLWRALEDPQMATAIRRCLEVLPVLATITGAAVTDHANDIAHPL